MPEALPAISAPDPIFNCPGCTLWLPPGTLACPECHAIVYARYLDGVARRAAALEGEQKWPEARGVWQSALQWLPPGTTQAAAVQGRIDTIDARSKAAEDTKAKWVQRLGPLAPVAFFLLKAKTFLLAIFKFKFLLSFVAFFGLYWAVFGWRFGLGITLSVLIHELGHYVAVRRRGLKADLPVFLPGLGAYVRWYAQGMSLATLAEIALAGPAAGLLAAVGCLAVYRGSPVGPTRDLFGALANVGAWINLFNLIPVFGLDGAQATLALTRLQRVLVLVTSAIFGAITRQWVFGFIAVGMALRVAPIWGRDVPGPPSIRSVQPAAWDGMPGRPSSRTMVGYMLLLFALGGVLALAPEMPR